MKEFNVYNMKKYCMFLFLFALFANVCGCSDNDVLPSKSTENLWENFISLFGSDRNTVKTTVESFGCSYSFSDYSYSVNGSDYYEIKNNNDYADFVGFVFNTDNQLSQCWVYYKSALAKDVYTYLTEKNTDVGSEILNMHMCSIITVKT